ncbi:MAG TPA: glutaredoxin domain-containing protein [Chloroflexota bacterium]|jgi:mycoredoxin|nr:glutaredoxin domain-containing protein [Chloroflexota bacterium]
MEPITLYATTWCGGCWRVKAFLDRRGVPYRWVDIDQTPGAEDIVMRINRGFRSVPTLVFSDGGTLTEPTSRELADKLGIDAGLFRA